jgi:hypothetical protein
LSIADVLKEISVPLSNYRFSVMYQKANEVLAEVRNLGAALLSTLEKRDAEALSTLRSGQELRLLQTVRDVRVQQIAEAERNIAALQQSEAMAQARKDFYESRKHISEGELASLTLSRASLGSLVLSEAHRGLAAVLGNFGVIKLGSPTTAGAELGPGWTAWSILAAASGFEVGSNILSIISQLTGRVAEYTRRQDEWDHQANLATIELKQLDQQLLAAEIRLAIAQQELANHDQQIDNASATDEFLRSKFTNQDLYQRMVGEISGVYFQSYQLAYDLSKRAELCMQHELGLKYGETSFIRFGYWDSLKKGLLAGDHLAYDLKRLDVAYCDGNIREYELTKHISLVALAPDQLIQLKENGSCRFTVPEWLFDLDTPGHFLRRMKSLSLTIPCVSGPYTTVHCKAQLLSSSYRQNSDLGTPYDRLAADDPSAPDVRFVDDRKILESKSIVTSSAQNDAGLFEPSLRDERYLPFEGAGAISTWQLELPAEFRTFDYGTISDVILHLRYTARDGGEALRHAAVQSLQQVLADAAKRPLFRFFSLRHEFPAEWSRFVNSPGSAMNALGVDFATTRFPYFAQARAITIQQASAVATSSNGAPPQIVIAPGSAPADLTKTTWPDPATPGIWTVGTSADPKTLSDVFVILAYTI